MQQPVLVILAAGMASRYGSLKQIQTFGPSGETIMDYAIYDALQAGFKKVVFVIRQSFAEEFKKVFGSKLEGKVEIEYVYQEMDAFLGGRSLPAARTKPFGTGHAILCCKNIVKGPFAVINADDFYGRDAFEKGYHFLTTRISDQLYGSIGYSLINTLSENGSVNRGEIETDDSGSIIGIEERVKIRRIKGDGIVYEQNELLYPLSENAKVSMNFFCFNASFIDLCYDLFQQFLDNRLQDTTAEFYMPQVADYYIKSGLGKIEMIPTNAKWFGVTYKEDAPIVKANIEALIKEGTYPSSLWG